jgi:hypothetical protein
MFGVTKKWVELDDSPPDPRVFGRGSVRSKPAKNWDKTITFSYDAAPKRRYRVKIVIFQNQTEI